MSQVSSDNEPLKPQELGSAMKVKKPSQKQLFEEAQARKAGAKAHADWLKKQEEEKEASAERRRAFEREKFMKRVEKETRRVVNLAEVPTRKQLEDFLPTMPCESNREHDAVMHISDFMGKEDGMKDYHMHMNEGRKDLHKYNAKLNKHNAIDAENAKYMAAMSRIHGYAAPAALGGKFAAKIR